MILIADSGASKTDWRLLAGERVSQFESPGFNPTSAPPGRLKDCLPEGLLPFKDQIGKLYYYGAGVTDQNVQTEIKITLSSIFSEADVEVQSDLVGAARSLFGKDKGIACILGTGSAACTFDGNMITERIPSLGYLLGDEGSGFYFGKIVVNNYLRRLLPDTLNRKFEADYGGLSEAEVLKKSYGNGSPKTYLAGFSQFVVSNQADPYLYQLVYEGFQSFFKAYFGDFHRLRGERIRFTGSIAHFLSNILLKVGKDHGLTIDLISQKPIAGLTLYHRENG